MALEPLLGPGGSARGRYWPEWPTVASPTALYPGSFVQNLPTTGGDRYPRMFIQTGQGSQRSVASLRGVEGGVMIVAMNILARLAACVLPLAIAVVLFRFHSSMPTTEAALIVVVVIVTMAAFGDPRSGVLAAVSAGVLFDFFLSSPYERLSITRRHNIETTVLLFVRGLPGRVVDLPVEYGSPSYGRFALTPTPGHLIPVERRLVAAALASDVGAILAGPRTRRES